MKISIPIMIFMLCFCFKEINAGKIKILVSNLDNAKGTIHYAIYNSPEFFPDEKGKLIGGFKNVSEVNKTGIVVNNLKESNYAVAIYHDQNSNNEFDTFLAIPIEKFGFSKNAEVFFGPPKFEEASIFVGEKETVEIAIELR